MAAIAESCLKVYHLSEHPLGLVEPTRQLERKAAPRRTGGYRAADKESLSKIIQPEPARLKEQLQKQLAKPVITTENDILVLVRWL